MKPDDLIPCPHCGESLLPTATSCRECGSDAKTGWLDGSEQDYLSVELPEDDEVVSAPQARGMVFKIGVLLLLAGAVYSLWVYRGFFFRIDYRIRGLLIAAGLGLLFYKMLDRKNEQ